MAYVRIYDQPAFSKKQELPFKIKFNFEKIINHWRTVSESGLEEANIAKALLAKITKNAPILLSAFEDIAIIEKHQEEIKALLAPLFPTLTTLNDIKAVTIPFTPILFNVSERLNNILDTKGNHQITIRQDHADRSYINACIFILNFKYGTNINNKRAFYFDIANKQTGIINHYRAFMNADFSSFIPAKDFKPLSSEEIKELVDNFDDIASWKKKIPPSSFTYEGFTLVKLFDVTEEEAISALKVDLLKKDALQSPDTVEKIRTRLSSLLSVDNLKIGFAAYNNEKGVLKPLGHRFWNSLTLSSVLEAASESTFCHSSHACLFRQKKILVYSDCMKKNIMGEPLFSKLRDNNIKSYIAIPLIYDGEIVGLFELGSEETNKLNAITVNKLQQIIFLFTTALMRSIDESETKIEAIVQQQFTAIHPTVSWRFFDAAENLIKRKQVDPKAIIEEIEFPEVFPLFGQSDIRGSSTERNKAIQADMVEQLNLAKNILDLAIERYHLPIYNQLKYKLDTSIAQMEKGLRAGDEVEVLEFLKKDIYPIFRYFRTLDKEINEAVVAYKQALDEDLGVIYNKREEYEQSVRLINSSISDYLEIAQVKAQEMFPHYFEKYKTDGVEHNIYIGQSIVNQETFNELHLQNLRLWQLMTICEIENLMEFEIKPKLKIPLSIASLVLVHHTPITIKFRQEEKRFDVEGAYNIRYEIMKKRIDKATIKGTSERLTQTGKIAIIYSQDKESREYRQYIEYLQSIKYITENVEWVDLGDLQGVSGLKAIRVEVIYQSKNTKRSNPIRREKKSSAIIIKKQESELRNSI